MVERRAKIIATIGPSSDHEETMRGMIMAGMDVARLNFSHGTHREHELRILKIRDLSREIGKPISILLDLRGPKLRVGELPKEGIGLVEGTNVRLVGKIERNIEDPHIIPLDVPSLERPAEPSGKNRHGAACS